MKREISGKSAYRIRNGAPTLDYGPNGSESATFDDGNVVIKQGDSGDAFYIIESGEATVTQTDDKEVEHTIKCLKKGDYFGGKYYN
jgi:CRP-like cAMP-binding protein